FASQRLSISLPDYPGTGVWRRCPGKRGCRARSRGEALSEALAIAREVPMKKLFALAMLVALAGMIGCNQSPPGGPGATGNTGSRGHVGGTGSTGHTGSTEHTGGGILPTGGLGQADNTFKLQAPGALGLPVDIKQGETKTVDISISRGKNFDQDV